MTTTAVQYINCKPSIRKINSPNFCFIGPRIMLLVLISNITVLTAIPKRRRGITKMIWNSAMEKKDPLEITLNGRYSGFLSENAIA